MDWQVSVALPAMTPVFWGLVRTPPEQRDHAAIAQSKTRTTEAMALLDRWLADHRFVAGDAFSMGDIPVGALTYRFRFLVPERPPMPHLDRWYELIAAREAFRTHVSGVPIT